MGSAEVTILGLTCSVAFEVEYCGEGTGVVEEATHLASWRPGGKEREGRGRRQVLLRHTPPDTYLL